MERELWSELSRAVRDVDAAWAEWSPRYVHRTAAVVRVHLWSALHDRPTSWACDPAHWPGPRRELPDQSTVSRRKRRPDFGAYMDAVGARLAGAPAALALVKRLDGRPLPVAAHGTGRDVAWGRGAGQQANGYKPHALRGGRAMPEQWAVTPPGVCERRLARRFAQRLGGGGGGYVLADAYYDAGDLHDRFAAADHQLVAPRRRTSRGRGLGHCRQSPRRLRSVALTEPPPAVPGAGAFGAALVAGRDQVERDFGNLASFGSGLAHLPPWARRIWRVRSWVHAKLLVNAARIRCRRRAAGA